MRTPPPRLAEDHQAVALLPIESRLTSPMMLRAIENGILNEIDEVEGLRAVSPGDVQNDLQQYGLDATACGRNTQCAAQAGRYSRAHKAIQARVLAVGGAISISMRLIDTEKGTEEARVAETVAEEPNERALELHRMAVRLLRPDHYVGTLTVDCAEQGADVYLDDSFVGTTPLPGPLEGQRAGTHILRIAKPGFSDVYRFVKVPYRRASKIEVDLNNATISASIEVLSTTGLAFLHVATTERGVEVRVDGEPAGFTPLTEPIGPVAAGERRLSFRKPGMEPLSIQVDTEPGQRTDIRLSADEGELQTEILGAVEPSAPLPGAEVITAMMPHEVGEDGKPLQGEQVGRSWKPSWMLRAGLPTAGLGALGLLAASYYAYQVRETDREASDLYTGVSDAKTQITADQYMAHRAQLDELNDEGTQLMRNQWIALGLGGTLVLTGASLTLAGLFAEPEPEQDVPLPEDPSEGVTSGMMSVAPLDGGVMLGLTWAWW